MWLLDLGYSLKCIAPLWCRWALVSPDGVASSRVVSVFSMLVWVRYWNQRRPPLKSGCYWCRPNYQPSLSFHTLSSLHSVVWGWLLDPVSIWYKQWCSTDRQKYTRTMAATAWVVGGLSSDHPHSLGRQTDWIHHLRIQIKLSISSSHLQLESLWCRVIVLQRMWCKNYAQARISAVCQPFDVAAQRTCSAGCKRNNAFVKVDRVV